MCYTENCAKITLCIFCFALETVYGFCRTNDGYRIISLEKTDYENSKRRAQQDFVIIVPKMLNCFIETKTKKNYNYRTIWIHVRISIWHENILEGHEVPAKPSI